MAEEIVRIIKVDTKNSGKSIKDLRNEIKALRTELEKTEVGSEEFSAALKQLTQTQKEYNSVQEQVRDMSRTNQQDMVRFASFAQNLGKAYSALNAAVGLFADKNEDVQKAMLRVQRTIQLVQGLDGIAGLVRDIPKVLAGFRNWFNALDPIEKRVNNIVKGINGVDPAKLREINEFNRNASNASATATAKATTTTAGSPQAAKQQTQQLVAQNQAIGEQTRLVMALNQARDEAYQKVEALTKRQEVLQKTLADEKLKADALNQTFKQQGVSISELTARLSKLEKIRAQAQALPDTDSRKNITLQLTEQQIKDTKDLIAVEEGLIGTRNKAEKAAKDANAAIAKNEKEISKVNKKIAEYNALLDGSASAATRAGRYMKSLFSTVGWTVVVSLLVSAVFWLGKYLLNLKSAAEKQKEFNAELNKTAVQIQSKQIVALRQLSRAYREVGDSAEAKQKFLKDYADRLKDVGLEIDNVNAAELVFRDKTDAFEQAIIKRSKALAAEQLAMKTYQEAMEKVAELEAERDSYVPSAADISGYIGSGYIDNSITNPAAELVENYKTRINKEIDDILAEADKKVNKLFDFSFGLRAEAQETEDALNALNEAEKKAAEEAKKQADAEAAAKAAAEQAWKERMEQRKRDLEDLKKANEDALKATMTDRTKELWEVETHYDQLIELAKKYKQDTTLLEAARQIEIQKIIDKYNKQALEDEQKRIDEQYQLIQTEIERIRRMNDTSNLRQPQEYEYKTHYQRPALEGLFFDDAMLRKMGVPGFATGTNWWSLYQSKEDVEDQLKALVEYNDRVYLLTKQRIEQENKKLNEQLNIVGLDADKRLEIERTLAENEMALSDAKIANEEANTQAFLDAQEKRREALISVLDVASTSLNAMSSIFRTEAQIHQTESQDLTKSQKEREDAAKKMESAMQAYKAFAITQAIVDTWKSANEAYAAMASIPYVGPALGIAASAAAVLSGMANVRAIMSESMTSQSQSSSVTAPSAMQAPPIEYTRSLVGDKELDEINQPIRCYVLESDISKTQNKVKVTEQNATF